MEIIKNKSEFMRASQVAKEYPVSKPTLWRWAKDGKIKAIKVSSGVTVFLRGEIEVLFGGEVSGGLK